MKQKWYYTNMYYTYEDETTYRNKNSVINFG